MKPEAPRQVWRGALWGTGRSSRGAVTFGLIQGLGLRQDNTHFFTVRRCRHSGGNGRATETEHRHSRVVDVVHTLGFGHRKAVCGAQHAKGSW